MFLLVILITIMVVALKIVDALSIPTFLVFLVLKLCGVISWGWFYICLPLIIFAGAMILTLLLGLALNALGED